MKSFYAISLLIFLFANTGYAQQNDYQFERIASEVSKVEKGLSQNSINCIFQDSKGFIWVGTWDGLNKYDGYKFIFWNESILADEKGISSSTVKAITEDKNGFIWVGTEAGLNRYDRKSNSFISYKKTSSINSIVSDTILDIVKDKTGNLWIGTTNGLSQYIIKDNIFVNYRNNPKNKFSLASNRVNTLTFDVYGDLWVGTENGLDKFDVSTKRFTHYNRGKGLVDNAVADITCDKNGQLWIATMDGLSVLSISNGTFKNFKKSLTNSNSLSSDVLTSIYVDKYNVAWIGTAESGLCTYNITDNIFSNYKYESNSNESLSNDFVSCVFEDKSENIWIGTSWKGLNKIVRNKKRLGHLCHISGQPNTLNSNLVWSFSEDSKGDLWIATDEGINIYNKKTQKFSFITTNPRSQNSLPTKHIRELFFDKEGNLWIGSTDRGLALLNPKTGKYKYYEFNPDDPGSISYNSVWPIIQTKNGTIIVGTEFGLNIYNKATDNFTRLMPNKNDPNSISNPVVYSLLEDSKGYLWIGTIDGLNKYNLKTKKNIVFKHSPHDKQSISNSRIFSIFEDSKHRFWIGTIGGGLNRYFPETNTFKYYTINDGLPNNVVYDVLEDDNGLLWMNTNYGLCSFNPATEKFVNYDVKDGVQGSEFNMGAAFKMKDGDLAFGGMNGLNLFNPCSFKDNLNIPNIVVTSLKIFNQVQNKEYFNRDTIFLTHDQNFLSFEFSAMDFCNPAKNKYAYKLYPLVKDWVYTGAEKRTAEYTDLAPGTYRLKIKASNSDGKWNEDGIVITIIIKPAWYQTFIFKILLFLFFVIVLWQIIYFRLKQIKAKHDVDKKILEIERQLFNLEQQALRLQMNPHFIFNSLNSIQSFVINNDTDKAIRYLSKFAQLMRMILSHSREAYIPINDELKSLSHYMEIEQLRFNFKFDFLIEIDKDIDSEFISVPPMIIQPYVENAIMHGIMHLTTKGMVVVKVKILDETSLLCVIQDNGVGREKAMEIKNKSGISHKSQGMAITKERLEILNNQNKSRVSVNVIDLYDFDNKAIGTKVEIVIPTLDY